MHSFDSWAPGQDDWVARWQQMYDAERTQGEAATHPDMHRSADQYAAIAARYAARTRRTPQPDDFMRWLLPHIAPGMSVLDIGAGTGRYVAPLLAAGCHVTALEPSAAMRGQLLAAHAETAPDRLQVVTGTWPETNVPHCDVAMAVHVLYAVRDVAPFLLAMDAVARERCVVVLGARHPTTPILPLWAAYHGERRAPLPAAYECLAVLAQLGIAADVSVLPAREPMSYPSRADAIDDICYRLRLPWDAPHRAAVAEVLAATWQITADGPFVVPEPVPPHLVLSWRPNGNRAEEKHRKSVGFLV